MNRKEKPRIDRARPGDAILLIVRSAITLAMAPFFRGLFWPLICAAIELFLTAYLGRSSGFPVWFFIFWFFEIIAYQAMIAPSLKHTIQLDAGLLSQNKGVLLRLLLIVLVVALSYLLVWPGRLMGWNIPSLYPTSEVTPEAIAFARARFFLSLAALLTVSGFLFPHQAFSGNSNWRDGVALASGHRTRLLITLVLVFAPVPIACYVAYSALGLDSLVAIFIVYFIDATAIFVGLIALALAYEDASDKYVDQHRTRAMNDKWRACKRGSWPSIRDKVWEVEHQGHLIRVINKFSILPPSTSEELEIDGVLIKTTRGHIFRTQATLSATHVLNDQKRDIEVRIGTKMGGVTTGCQILIDGKQVAGDEKIQFITQTAASKVLEKGFLRYFLTMGLPAGLIYATVMLITNNQIIDDNVRLVGTFLFSTLFFGLIIAGFFWWSMKSSNNRSDQ